MQDAAFADVRSGHEHGIRIDGGALAYADVLAHVDAGKSLTPLPTEAWGPM